MIMYEVSDCDALEIKGGFNLTGAMLNGIYRAINSLLAAGRSLGTAIRMIQAGKMCSL